MRRIVFVLAVALGLGGCGTIYKEPTGAHELGPQQVLLVGRIELVPPLAEGEQQIKAAANKNYIVGKAALFTAAQPQRFEQTREALNPDLERTFFIAVPADRRHVVYGAIVMELTSRGQTKMLIPPLDLDIRPGDRAVYIGTVQLHRDEFHSVTKLEVLDHHAAASKELSDRYGGHFTLRKALAQPAAFRR